MELSKPTRWREGMPLRPQHFQQRDLAQEAREIWLRRGLEPHWWGLEYLELIETQLDKFQLQVKALRAVLPGGTLLDVPGNARLPGRDFAAEMRESGRTLEVRVGVRMREERVGQTGDGAGRESRYVVHEEEVRDMETGQSPFPVEKLCLDARIFFGDEPAPGYEVLPICALKSTGNPSQPVVVDTEFAPPCLTLAASPALTEITRGVVSRIGLALDDARTKGWGDDRFKPICMQAAAGAYPVLRDMVADGCVHPAVVAREMARLAGAMSIRPEVDCTEQDVGSYDHARPGSSFTDLAALIARLVKFEVEVRHRRIGLVAERDLLVVKVPAEHRIPGHTFYLEVDAAESTPRLDNLLAIAKVSTPARIEAVLKKSNMLGVFAERMPGPPAELPPGTKGNFFRLRSDGNEWTEHVVADGTLAVYIVNRPADVRMNLIVILPKA